jgi:L-fuconolactonase
LITEADHDNWTSEDIAPYGRAVIGEFGAERVMFGSDWPVCTLAGDYLRVVGLVDEMITDLPDEQREMIMGGTAARWYRLKED